LYGILCIHPQFRHLITLYANLPWLASLTVAVTPGIRGAPHLLQRPLLILRGGLTRVSMESLLISLPSRAAYSTSPLLAASTASE